MLNIFCSIAIIYTKCTHPSTQLMLFLSILDIIQLAVNSILTGFLGREGLSYCNHPKLIFIAGALGNGAWLTASPTCILLTLERMTEAEVLLRVKRIFKDGSYFIVLFCLFVWTIYSFLFTSPALFSSNHLCWLYNPLIGKDVCFWKFLKGNCQTLISAINLLELSPHCKQ